MKKLNTILFIFAILVSFASASQVQAAGASLYLSPASGSFNVGQMFSANVMLNTGGEAISATEGTLSFPIDKLTVKSISKNNSILGLWVEEPAVSGGTISFIGGVIGGFTGTGRLFSIVFQAKNTGTASVDFMSGARAVTFAAEPVDILESTQGGKYTLQEKVGEPKGDEISTEDVGKEAPSFEIPAEIPPGYVFEKELKSGDKNIDAAYLQLCLAFEGIYSGNIDGSFGPATRSAVIEFQEKYFEEILEPWGFTSGTGLVSNTTLVKLNELCFVPVPEEIPALPAQLFDINLEIDNPNITEVGELASRVIFTNLGTEPTLIDLTFSIVNEAGEEVYSEKDDIFVEIEAVLTKTFETRGLDSGKYTLILTTLYSVDVEDKFIQFFEIKKEEKSAFNLKLWIFVAGIVLLITVLIRYFAYLKNER